MIGFALALGSLLTTGATAGYLAAASMVVGVYTAREQRRKAQRAADSKIKDRNVMVREATADRPHLFGRLRTSGQVQFPGSSGAYSEKMHFALALGDEIDAVEDVWFGDASIGARDADGFATEAPYGVTRPEPAFGSFVVSVSRTVTLPHLADAVLSVAIGSTFDYDGGTQFYVGNPATDALAYSIATVGGVTVLTFNSAQVGRSVVVNYSHISTVSYARAKALLGASGQVADPYLIAELPSTWSASDKFAATSYISGTWVANNDLYPTGILDVSVVIRGEKCFDPRYGTTVWTRNPALIAWKYLSKRFPNETYNSAALIAAANVCDEPVPIAAAVTISTLQKATVCLVETSGAHGLAVGDTVSFAVSGMTELNGQLWTVTKINSSTVFEINTNSLAYGVFLGGNVQKAQSRYTFDGAISSELDHKSGLERILQAMVGSAVRVAGAWYIWAGAWEEPSMALDEDDLAPGEIIVQGVAEDGVLFNGIGGRYTDPTRWVEDSFPAYISPAYVALDNGETEILDVDLTDITDVQRVQRVSRLMLHKARQALTFACTLELSAYAVYPGRMVTWTLAKYGWDDKPFRCLSRVYSPSTGTVKCIFQEDAEAIYASSYSELVNVDPAPNTNLPNPLIVTTPVMTYASGAQFVTVESDGSQRPYLRVYWQQMDESVEKIEIWWRKANATTWQSATVAAENLAHDLYGISQSQVYVVMARAINGLGVRSAWAAASVTISDDAPINGSMFVGGIGANLLSNTRFLNSAQGWYAWYGTPVAVVDNPGPTTYQSRVLFAARTFDGSPFDPSQRPIPSNSIQMVCTSGASGNEISFIYTIAAIPVQPGQRMEAQALAGGTLAGARVSVLFYDANDAYVSRTNISGGVSEMVSATANSTRENFDHLWGFVTVPSGITRARWAIYVDRKTTGGTGSRVAFAEPYLGIAHEGQTEPTPWAPGPSGGLIEGLDAVTEVISATVASQDLMTTPTLFSQSFIPALDGVVEITLSASLSATRKASVQVSKAYCSFSVALRSGSETGDVIDAVGDSRVFDWLSMVDGETNYAVPSYILSHEVTKGQTYTVVVWGSPDQYKFSAMTATGARLRVTEVYR
jgi:hypothetical protein